MAKDHGPSIKDDEQYEALRDEGMTKEKAARIANSGKDASRRGGHHVPYEDWTMDELYERAKELDIAGRSEMTKAEIIAALRT